MTLLGAEQPEDGTAEEPVEEIEGENLEDLEETEDGNVEDGEPTEENEVTILTFSS